MIPGGGGGGAVVGGQGTSVLGTPQFWGHPGLPQGLTQCPGEDGQG